MLKKKIYRLSVSSPQLGLLILYLLLFTYYCHKLIVNHISGQGDKSLKNVTEVCHILYVFPLKQIK